MRITSSHGYPILARKCRLVQSYFTVAKLERFQTTNHKHTKFGKYLHKTAEHL